MKPAILWCVVDPDGRPAPWYCSATRSDAIDNVTFRPSHWRRLRRTGWRCVKFEEVCPHDPC